MTSDSKKPARAKSPSKKSKRPVKAGAAKLARARAKVEKRQRLRPGELDDLVLTCLADHKAEWPMTATAVAKAIGRSSGAVANCLHRLAEAKPNRARLTSEQTRAYDLKGGEGWPSGRLTRHPGSTPCGKVAHDATNDVNPAANVMLGSEADCAGLEHEELFGR